MNDPIDRQAAIDALRYAQHRFTVADEAGGMGTVKWSEDVIYFAAAERVLTELPPAQPEHDENDLDFVQTHKRIPVQLVVSSDCISRQAAIDLCDWYDNPSMHDDLEKLPSAQPYTEAEIQKMQDLYQAEIDEAFELGREDAWSDIIHCGECKHVGTDATCCLVCCREGMGLRPYHVYQDDYCSYAERKEEKEEAGEVDE